MRSTNYYSSAMPDHKIPDPGLEGRDDEHCGHSRMQRSSIQHHSTFEFGDTAAYVLVFVRLCSRELVHSFPIWLRIRSLCCTQEWYTLLTLLTSTTRLWRLTTKSSQRTYLRFVEPTTRRRAVWPAHRRRHIFRHVHESSAVRRALSSATVPTAMARSTSTSRPTE